MALTIQVKVTPGSGKSEWCLDKQNKLKCFLKSAPEKGSANRELIKTLSKLLKVPQLEIEIVMGLTDRNKTIKVHTDITLSQFLDRVGIIEVQIELTK